MNYQEFLQRFGSEDSPSLRQAWQEQFGIFEGSENLGLSSPPVFDYASGSRIFGPTGNPGKMWGPPTGHVSAAGRGGMTEDYANSQVPEPFYQNQVDFLNVDNSGVLESGSPAAYQGGGLTGEGELVDPWATPKPFVYNDPARPHPPPEVFSSHPFFEPGETNISQGPGLLTNAPDYSDAELQALGLKTGGGLTGGLSTTDAVAQAYPGEYGVGGIQTAAESAAAVEAAEEGLLAAEAAESGWGGPWTFAANQALSMIPTRDKEKTSTPFGEEGSKSGILKGTGKGALLGGTIGSYVSPGAGTAIGAAIGGGLGLVAGSQGYFDSTSAPIINMTRIKRRGGGGMQGGLLGGGSMYG